MRRASPRLPLRVAFALVLGASVARGDEPAAAPPARPAAAPSTPPSPTPTPNAPQPEARPAETPPAPPSVDIDIARAHFDAGLANYNASRYAEAVSEFREAYRLSHRADLLFNIGRAYERAGDPGRASSAYRGYLAARPQAAERPELERTLIEFRASVGTLHVRASVPAEVLVDDVPAGVVGDEIALTSGVHQVSVRSPGYLPSSTETRIAAGSDTTLTLEPQPLAAPAPSAAPHAAATGSKKWVIGVVVGVVAVVAAGAVVGAVAATSHNDLRASARTSCTGSGDCAVIDWNAGAAR